MKIPMVLFLALPIASKAFSSIPYPQSASYKSQTNPHAAAADSTTLAPWRVVLDIGREPLASMPFNWARSGCRLPLKIPLNFQSDNVVVPKTETVSFTGPGGAVVRPIQGGSWKLSNDQKQLSLSLTFPEAMERRDVWIDAETSVTLEGRVFTQKELDQLNQEFYEARDEAWALGEELNNINKIKYGPKKWNEEKQVWEKRTDSLPSIFVQGQKRMQLLAAQNLQKQKNEKRPNPNTLSERGSLPGIKGNVYIAKEGTIRLGTGNKAVMGKWYAEPIMDQQVSYISS